MTPADVEPDRDQSVCDRPTIPGYEILGELAGGVADRVFTARQLSLDRILVLKVSRAGPVEAARLRDRARVVAGFWHPNLVGIHEVGEHEGQSFVVMDHVAGRSFVDLVREKPLPADRA